jgi:hypothetical protein
VGEDDGIASLLVKQALEDAVGSRGPDERDIRVARSVDVSDDPVLVSTLGMVHLEA